jgi:putative ABC transport system permease protein
MRWALLTLGIALGLTSFTGVTAISRSIIHAFDVSVTRGAGAAQLQVSNGTAGVDAQLVDALADLDGVETASGNVQYPVDASALGPRRLTVFGIPMGADDRYRRAQFGDDVLDISDEIAFLSRPESVALPERLLETHGLQIGSSLDVVGPKGIQHLVVRGVLHPRGALRVFGDDVAIMDAEAAQLLFGVRDKFHWVDVVVRPDASVEDVRRRAVEAVGGRGSVESPRGRSARIEAMLGSLRTMLAATGIVAMLVGVFLIYHTINTAVARREGELSTLWALGTPRRQLASYVLIEATVVGLVGSAVGVAAGLAFAALAAGSFGQVISDMYTPVPVSGLRFTAWEIGLALLLGVGCVVLAAAIPCLRVLRPPPEFGDAGEERRRLGPGFLAAAGLVTFALALLVARATRLPDLGLRLSAIGLFAALVFAGATLFVPLVVSAVTPVLSRLLRGTAGVLGAWMWEQVRKRAMHTTTTMGSLAAGVAFALGMTTMLGSYRSAFVDWIRQFARADVFVNAGTTISLLGGPTVDLALQSELSRVDGVERVMPWRVLEVEFRGSPVIVQGLDERLIERMHGPGLDHERGEVVISDSLAERYAIAEGDTLTLPAPTAPLVVTVKAVRPDYVLDLGSVKVGWELFRRHYDEHAANILLIDARPGTEARELAQRIKGIVAGRYGVSVLSQAELSGLLDELIDQSFALTYWLEGLAILVTILAMVNATSAAIIDRGQDLVTLRALGMTRKRLVRLLMLEAAIVGALGSLLGLVAGGVLGGTLVRTVMPAVAGFRLPIVWPWTAHLALFVLSIGAATTAAYFITRRWTERPVALEASS